jgi:hypothetical protein
MLSQSANDLCISLLVRDSDAGELLEGLHRALIEENSDATVSKSVFGPGWQELMD